MIEERLFEHITSDANMTALVDTRVYPLTRPQNGELPALVYGKVSTQQNRAAEGDTGRVRARFQIDVVADSYAEAKTVAAQLKKTMASFEGLISGEQIWFSALDSERDIFEPVLEVKQIPMDFMIAYQEG